MVAYRSGCDVIPVFIETKGNKYGIFKRVHIHYGKPIKRSELGFENGGTEEYKTATEIIFSRLIALGGYSYNIESKEQTLEN